MRLDMHTAQTQWITVCRGALKVTWLQKVCEMQMEVNLKMLLCLSHIFKVLDSKTFAMRECTKSFCLDLKTKKNRFKSSLVPKLDVIIVHSDSCFCLQIVYLAKTISHCSLCSAFLSNWKSRKYKCDSTLYWTWVLIQQIALKEVWGVISHVVAGIT